MEIVEKQARRHIKGLNNSLKEKMKNGTYPEQASLIVSMHCSNQQKILEGQNNQWVITYFFNEYNENSNKSLNFHSKNN